MSRLLRTLSTVLGVALTVLFVGLAALPVIDAGAMIVTSGSMEPTIATGSVAVIRDVSPEEVAEGDILTYRGYTSSAPTTHRVISLHEVADEPHFRTQGDANEAPDPDLVPAGGVIGRVWFWLPGLGWALGWLRTPLGRGLVLGLPASVILLREVASVVRALRGGSVDEERPLETVAGVSDDVPATAASETSGSALFPAEILPDPEPPTAASDPAPPPVERRDTLPTSFSAHPQGAPRRRSGPTALGPLVVVTAVLGGAVGVAATRALVTDTVVVGDNTFRTADDFLLP